MAGRIVWTPADGEPVEFALTKPVMTIGRDEEADIQVDEPLVSRAHARLEQRGADWFVVDLGSTNLTRVNEHPVSQRRLEDGDELRFARARCRFFSGPAAAEPAPEP